MQRGITRIGLFAKRGAASCLNEVTGHGIEVIAFDQQPFPLTHSFPQFEGLPGVFYGQGGFAEVCVTYAHCPVSRGEIRVELRGSLEKGQRRSVIARSPSLIT